MVDKDWWDTVTSIKCEDEECGGYTYKDELEKNDWECPHCGKPIPKPE
jgi:acetyl-CoA carboxylase beta subunit